MADESLTRNRLKTAEAAWSVGVVAASALLHRGVATLFVNAAGEVEICPYEEVSVDGLPEEQAIASLTAQGYSDIQLENYLRGRDVRRGG